MHQQHTSKNDEPVVLPDQQNCSTPCWNLATIGIQNCLDEGLIILETKTAMIIPCPRIEEPGNKNIAILCQMHSIQF